MLRLLGRSLLGSALVFSCLPSVGSAPDAVGVTGDHLYRGVLAGSTGSGSAQSGTLSAIYLDPSNDGASAAGPSRSKDAEMVAQLMLGGARAVVRGAVSGGAATLTGSGWNVNITLQGDGSMQGTYSTSGGAAADGGSLESGQGNLAGVDDSDGTAKTLCGTYRGSIASGTWNFVVSGSGLLAGSFYGSADGNLTGSVSGDSITMRWSGSAFGSTITGTATGTLSPDHASVQQGAWSADGGTDSGSFTSDATTCGAPEQAPQHSQGGPMTAECPCSQTPVPAGGACCEGGPAGSYCCTTFQ